MTPRLAALALTMGAGACAVTPTADIAAFATRTSANSFDAFGGDLATARALVLPVVHDRQTKGPSCGAHVLATVINYWDRSERASGSEIFAASPPAHEAGYAMAELVALAHQRGLLASAVRLPEDRIVAELERGRPVLAPVRVPAVYLQQRTLPGREVPFVGLAHSSLIDRTARFAEFSTLGLVDHYLLVVGYEGDTFVVVEPILGFRTIGRETLARYRGAFGDAAIVFSGQGRSGSAKNS